MKSEETLFPSESETILPEKSNRGMDGLGRFTGEWAGGEKWMKKLLRVERFKRRENYSKMVVVRLRYLPGRTGGFIGNRPHAHPARLNWSTVSWITTANECWLSGRKPFCHTPADGCRTQGVVDIRCLKSCLTSSRISSLEFWAIRASLIAEISCSGHAAHRALNFTGGGNNPCLIRAYSVEWGIPVTSITFWSLKKLFIQIPFCPIVFY